MSPWSCERLPFISHGTAAVDSRVEERVCEKATPALWWHAAGLGLACEGTVWRRRNTVTEEEQCDDGETV